ncbi:MULTISPECIES: glycosyltransferase family 2 protein [Bifidobacterium]|uniref:glycosyltransferase family 2 protein n=1 Tax=Bifidobacterium TaxID=1678 RepID=UPI00257D8B73|nr:MULTISPECIES: glycosyltransferase family 2 protein [Bifidobacterium]
MPGRIRSVVGERECRRTMTPTVTIIMPTYNEAAAVPAAFSRLDALAAHGPVDGCRYEFLVVDDGSTDATRSLVRDYAATRSNVGYVFLSRNFGKERAMLAGLDRANGDAAVIIDADMQDPPELIPGMVALWREGYDDVYARRRSRAGESWFKRATSRWYYRVLAAMSPVTIQPDTGDFRLLDRRCVLALRRLREANRNTKALFSWIGFRKKEILYDRDARLAGRSKWSYPKLVRLAIDGITSFSTAPLRVASYMGGIVSVLALVYAAYIVARTVVSGIDVPGYASLLVAVLFLGGLQLLALGVIGEYLGRMFTEVKWRPDYLVEEECRDAEGWDDGDGQREG